MLSDAMILVVGATGSVGSEICRRLIAESKPVRALVRRTSDSGKVARLRNMGAQILEGDLKDRRTLDSACAGTTAVISTASATISRQSGDTLQSVDLEGQIRLVDAAKATGVKHFIYLSAHIHSDIKFPLQAAKAAVEQHLRDSGMTWTILQPTMFMEIWLSALAGFDLVHHRAVVQGKGTNKISLISYKDVAAFAVASLDNPHARNATLVLGGPEPMNALQIIMLFEDFMGEKFAIQHVSEEELQRGFASAPDPMAKTFAGLGLLHARGDVIDMSEVCRDFPEVQLTSVRDYARTVLGYRRESTGVPD